MIKLSDKKVIITAAVTGAWPLVTKAINPAVPAAGATRRDRGGVQGAGLQAHQAAEASPNVLVFTFTMARTVRRFRKGREVLCGKL